MDWERLERSRRLLSARVDRAVTCPADLLPDKCYQLVSWLRAHPVFSGAVARIGAAEPATADMFRRIVETARADRDPTPLAHHVAADDALKHVAACLAAIETAAGLRRTDHEIVGRAIGALGVALGGPRVKPEQHSKRDETFREVALRELEAYLKENVELGYGIIESVLRYKQRSEWFRRERLRTIAKRGLEGRKGERALAIDLYEYVFDHNLEFAIEERTGSGQPDLVIRVPNGAYGILDAKLVSQKDKPATVRTKLRQGFHQVARYCEDFNEPAGVLAVFHNALAVPRLPLEEADGLSFRNVRGRRIYYILIDIFERDTASKAAGPEILITDAELAWSGPP